MTQLRKPKRSAQRIYLEQVILLPTVGRERELAETALELLDKLEQLEAPTQINYYDSYCDEATDSGHSSASGLMSYP